MEYVIDPPETPSLAVAGAGARFPVRRIYCVGRNYAAHAREMGHDPDREPPFFFQKNPDALLPSGSKFPYPGVSRDVHFEIELVCAIGTGGAGVAASDALDHVWGYAVGIDMTRRDLQGTAKKLGRPWEVGKAFDHSAPCTRVHPGRRGGASGRGADLARRERQDPAGRELERAHLDRAGDYRAALRPVHAGPR